MRLRPYIVRRRRQPSRSWRRAWRRRRSLWTTARRCAWCATHCWASRQRLWWSLRVQTQWTMPGKIPQLKQLARLLASLANRQCMYSEDALWRVREHTDSWLMVHDAGSCRVILEPAMEGRLRLDAATWGTMGVGLGYAIAAATTRPERLVVAVEGDSAFGFSGMECETISR